MAKHDELIIEPRPTGDWAVLKPHAERASSVEKSLEDALGYARTHAPEGDIKIKGHDGRFSQIQKPVNPPKKQSIKK